MKSITQGPPTIGIKFNKHETTNHLFINHLSMIIEYLTIISLNIKALCLKFEEEV